jgi:hypothetical protein
MEPTGSHWACGPWLEGTVDRHGYCVEHRGFLQAASRPGALWYLGRFDASFSERGRMASDHYAELIPYLDSKLLRLWGIYSPCSLPGAVGRPVLFLRPASAVGGFYQGIGSSHWEAFRPGHPNHSYSHTSQNDNSGGTCWKFPALVSNACSISSWAFPHCSPYGSSFQAFDHILYLARSSSSERPTPNRNGLL